MRTPSAKIASLVVLIHAFGVAGLPNSAQAQDYALPRYLQDRGAGIPTSMFGTYVCRGQFLLCPFYEYSRDHNWEYQPAKLGFGLDEDFRGSYRSSKEQVFIAYGVTDRLALEFEAAFITATFRKSPDDPSATSAKIDESGFGDIEGQLRF